LGAGVEVVGVVVVGVVVVDVEVPEPSLAGAGLGAGVVVVPVGVVLVPCDSLELLAGSVPEPTAKPSVEARGPDATALSTAGPARPTPVSPLPARAESSTARNTLRRTAAGQ